MATKLKQVIDAVDDIKPNSYTVSEKIAWVNELEQSIYTDITEWYDNYNAAESPLAAWFRWAKREDPHPALPYTEERDYRGDVAPFVDDHGDLRYPAPYLLVPLSYDDTGALYKTWLSAKIDYANGDIAKYNNGKVMFDEQYGAFMNWVNRRLLHKKTRIDYL